MTGIGTGPLSWEDAASWQALDRPVRPGPEAHRRYSECCRLYRVLCEHLKEDMARLSALRAPL